MNVRLVSRRVALLVEEDFDERHVTEPLARLQEAGVAVVIVGALRARVYHARNSTFTATAELAAGGLKAADVDAVFVPGGYAPDRMRLRHAMVDLVRDLVTVGKPVAAIDHGPQLLISAGVVRGRTITCWPSIAVDIKNAGGLYVDRPFVEDGPVITGRKSDDLPLLLGALLRALGLGVPSAS
ncbi:MAG: DJ-1/PfpI family protein [Vicinamibacterales bacterium]